MYSNSTKVILWFYPITRRMKWTFRCYIDKYDIRIYPCQSMYLGELTIQDFPSGV